MSASAISAENSQKQATPAAPAAKPSGFLNRIPADLLPFYKQLVPYYPYYSDYVPEDMVHVYRKLLPYFESTSNWKTSGLSSYWKGKEKRSIKMKDDLEALKRRDQEEDILLKIGQKMRELKMKQIQDNIQSQEILVEGLKKKYASMWKDEEGIEKKLDMGHKLAVEAEPGKTEEEDAFSQLPTSMATYRNFEDVMDEKFRRLMGDFGDLTVERRRLAWGGKKLKTGDEQDGMAGKGGFIGYSSGYRYRTRRAPRHGTIGYNVDSYYDVYVDDYFDEDVEPVPEPIAAPPPPKAETPVDPNLFAQDFIDAVPAVVDPVTTFNEEEFKHLEWDQDVVPVEDTFVPEPPEVPEGTGVYATVGADGVLKLDDGSVFEVLANGVLKAADGAIWAATGVILSTENALVESVVAFEGKTALADAVALAEGRKLVVKEQVAAGEGLVVLVGADGGLVGIDGKKYTMRADGKIVAEDNKVYKGTGKIVTAAQSVLTGASAALVDGVIQVNGQPLLAGAKIVIDPKEEEEEELEPPPKPVTIKGEVVLKDIKGDIFAEIHKDDVDGTIIGAESVIIIKNAKGKEVVRITRGYVTVKNFNVEEIVQIMRGVVSVKTIAGKEMVHVEKGEIYIEDFDGEVIVNNLADVNKLDEEMSLKNM